MRPGDVALGDGCLPITVVALSSVSTIAQLGLVVLGSPVAALWKDLKLSSSATQGSLQLRSESRPQSRNRLGGGGGGGATKNNNKKRRRGG